MASSSSAPSSWRSSATSSKGSEAQSCEVICNMLAMLSCSEKLDAHRTLLAMTNSPESCQSLRRAGCIPLLIQILHPGSATSVESQPSSETKQRASKALKNIVHFNRDEKMKRKESSVLRHLETVRGFTSSTKLPDPEKHPTSSSTSLMRHSFDEDHKNIMCTLGAIHALADLIVSDHKIHGSQTVDTDCILTRRYSCMTLTNLTFGDGVNKALLCSMNDFLQSLVSQLEFENEDIVQVTASVLRNLSWHADSNSRAALRDSHAVTALMKAALRSTKESTLKATLSALWNLSAHSNVNKAAICSTPNALKFLLSLLRRSKSMTIVENAGGILGNISSHITSVEEHRITLHEGHCFEILLEHLKSSSLTVVSNACGTLWNLSGHQEEQRKLLELKAVPMLKSLIYSKHERISQGASAALRNLLTYYEHTNELQRGQRQSYSEADSEQPLDLTITSCKSSPVRKLNPPPFLNPPIYNGSVSATRSCPDIQVKQQQHSSQQQQQQQQQHSSQKQQQKQHSSPSQQSQQQQHQSKSQQKQHHQPQPQQKKMEPSSDDTTFNYSHYDEMEEEEEEEKHQQTDTVKTYCDEGTPGFSGSMVDLSSQAVDSFIQFQVEDTPAIFSRTSSLSSIDEGNQHGENRAEKIQEHNNKKQASSPGPGSGSVSGNGNGGSNNGNGIAMPMPNSTSSSGHNSILVTNHHLNNSSVANPPVIPKRVMFSAEETPLMFSRCSSVASLESCGDLNINNGRESDCVSEFSRRTSEVVSPSELPDSPRATDQDPAVNPSEPAQEQRDTDFNEGDQNSNNKKTSSTNDELKVFAQEGTPFLISTATSLSDIIGELDNQPPANIPISISIPIQAPIPLPRNSLNQVHTHSNSEQRVVPPVRPPPKPITVQQQQQQQQQHHEHNQNQPEDQQQEPGNQHQKIPEFRGIPVVPPSAQETEPEEPIYSDDQLLQKVIKVGRAVGMGLPKRPQLHLPLVPHHQYQRQLQQQQQHQQRLQQKQQIEQHSSSQSVGGGDEDEVDLSHLIQRGRAKLIMTRSEDNLKQYASDANNMRPLGGRVPLTIAGGPADTASTASDPELLDYSSAQAQHTALQEQNLQHHPYQHRQSEQAEAALTMHNKFLNANGSLPSYNHNQRVPNINLKISQAAKQANNTNDTNITNTNSLKAISLNSQLLMTSKSIDGITTATNHLSLGPSLLINNPAYSPNENIHSQGDDGYEEIDDVYVYGDGDCDEDDDRRQTDTPTTTTTTATTVSATTPTTAKENPELYFRDDVTDIDNEDNDDTNTDDTDDHTPSQSDDRTWTDETPSFSSPIPSMSINKALRKVQGEMDETLSEIEQPTLYSLGTTLDSVGAGQILQGGQQHPHPMHRSMQMSMSSSGIQGGQFHKNNLHLLQSSSSQVSNLMNQKPPQEFFDLDSSMISVASIKSEIFEDGILPCVASPQLPSRQNHNLNQSVSPSDIGINASQTINEPSSPPTTVPTTTTATTPPLTKYDTYVIKRIESPKERRKNDPDRYITRTIDKTDLKMKPPVPPKPLSSSLSNSALVAPPVHAPVSTSKTIEHLPSTTTTTLSTAVRPTRASELRASRSREHSPTNSTVSLQTTTSNKIPPKPPVRSTPPLNTTLPRNAKLMENLHSTSSGSISSSSNIVVVMNPGSKSSSNTNASEPFLNNPCKDKDSHQSGKDKLNFGGRIGNLFRKSFSKHSGKNKQQKNQDHGNSNSGGGSGNVTSTGHGSGTGSGIWVKRREKEKALVSPFNYKPPNPSNPISIEKMITFSSSVESPAAVPTPTPTPATTAVNNNIVCSQSSSSVSSLRTNNMNTGLSGNTTATSTTVTNPSAPVISTSLATTAPVTLVPITTDIESPSEAGSTSAATTDTGTVNDGTGKTSSKITTV